MAQDAKFCAQCGEPLPIPNRPFCNQCGARRASQPVTPASESPTPPEPVNPTPAYIETDPEPPVNNAPDITDPEDRSTSEENNLGCLSWGGIIFGVVLTILIVLLVVVVE